MSRLSTFLKHSFSVNENDVIFKTLIHQRTGQHAASPSRVKPVPRLSDHQPPTNMEEGTVFMTVFKVLFKKSYSHFLNDPGFGLMVVSNAKAQASFGSNRAASLRESSGAAAAHSRHAARKHAGAHPSRCPPAPRRNLLSS